MGKRVALVLAGCGVFDGSEIHEASAALVHLSRGGAEVAGAGGGCVYVYICLCVCLCGSVCVCGPASAVRYSCRESPSLWDRSTPAPVCGAPCGTTAPYKAYSVIMSLFM